MKNIRQIFHKEIKKMGIQDNLLGEEYFYIAMDIIQEEPLRLCCMSKMLYIDIAKQTGTNPACIERNLRTLISKLWNIDNHKYLNKIAGYQLKKKPTNREFLDMMMVYWDK